MSGYTESAHLQQTKLDAPVQMLEKPFTKEALGLKVRQALAGET
jgi:hypothetical protein